MPAVLDDALFVDANAAQLQRHHRLVASAGEEREGNNGSVTLIDVRVGRHARDHVLDLLNGGERTPGTRCDGPSVPEVRPR